MNKSLHLCSVCPVRFAQGIIQIKSYLGGSAYLFQWKLDCGSGDFGWGRVHVIRPVQFFLYGQIVFCADVLFYPGEAEVISRQAVYRAQVP